LPTYKEIEKQLLEETIKCVECHEDDGLFHRTTVKNLEKIKESGKLTPSEIGAISLSSSDEHTYGGNIRIVFDEDKINQPLEKMCYISDENSEQKYDRISDREVRERSYMEKFPIYAYNKFAADMGITHGIYKSECEVMARKPISLDKIKKIEYWLAPKTMDFNPSCNNYHPHSIDIQDITWGKTQGEIMKAKKIAEELGVPFEVKSCFNAAVDYMFGIRKYYPLDKENLERIKNGKEPVGQKEPIKLKCRC